MTFDVVIPTVDRDSLELLLRALADGEGPLPERVIVVHDRPPAASGVAGGRPAGPHGGASHGTGEDALGPLGDRMTAIRGAGAGPAAARNLGWRAGISEWVAFLDDDVVPERDWRERLAADLSAAAPDVAAVQGRIEVPLPPGRRPTDWERNVRGLESAVWATADMAFRREALAAAGGFDERFRRAYREDSDLGLRLTGAGWRIDCGERRVSHPPGPAAPMASLRLQAGNADDVLMRALHGSAWREAAGAPPGRRPRHLAISAAAAAALGALAAGRRRSAALAAASWLAGTAELAWARIAPGPRTPSEILLMAATSAAMPPVAAWHTVVGVARLPALRRQGSRSSPRPTPPQPAPPTASRPESATRPGGSPAAVLLDRDGTLVVDVPYNGDPERVEPLPGARSALERLRDAGVRLAVVSNQSGIGRGMLGERDVDAVNRRVEELLGPLGPWLICPHSPDEGCDCRKPRPGLVLRAAERLGVEPERCALVGDIGADVEAARAAGARAVLVPNSRTRSEEVAAAPETAPDLHAAVDLLIGEAAA